jgi:uncharacterized protein (DUF58 family)
MLSPKLIQQIRNIELKAGHLVNDALAGEYVSVFRGVGMEFDKVREYEAGDDVRTIDWNVTARVNAPYVKIFREERELTLMLLVDLSGSQSFGSTGRFKHEIATELAAILAFLATKNNDKVGLILFSDHVEQFIPAKKGRSHVWRIIREILTHKPKGKGTNLKEALDYFNRVSKRRSMSFLLSDFCSENYEKSLELAAHRHDLVCVDIKDARERELPASGLITLQDAETGQSILVDTSDARFRQRFTETVQKEEKTRIDFFRRHKIDYFAVNTEEAVVQPLIRYIHQRERRLKMR